MIFLRQRVSRSVPLLEKMTNRIEHFFGKADRYGDFDPVSRGRSRQGVTREAMRSQPSVHHVDALRVGRDERVDFVQRQVVPVAFMERVAVYKCK